MTILFALLVTLAAEAEASKDRQVLIKALAPVGPLVGEWNGIATPKDRKSRRSRIFWREKSQWEWAFDDNVGLKWTVEGGKRFKNGLLTYLPDTQQFQLEMTSTEGKITAYSGKVIEDRIELDSPVVDGIQRRIWIRVVNENRFLYSVFEREEDKSRFIRILDTGNTRDGVTFAAGSSGPICIVTGGRGTTKVEYKGKTYYVCCTGCRQAFEDDPEGVIAEAAEQNETE